MKTPYRVFLLLTFIVVPVIVLYAQSINTLQPHVRNKIDPLLQQVIVLKEQSPKRLLKTIESYAAGTRLSTTTGDVVAVLIQCTHDIHEYIRSIGGMVGSQHGSIYTALIPVQSVAQIAQQGMVSYIEVSRWLFPSLDLSRAKTGADILQVFTDPVRRLTGKGVIIGFTDTGVNTTHQNFKMPDGRTRILYVWDQYSSRGGFPPEGFSYGIEKDSAAINASTWSMDDFYIHGTHVCGIAAGNGMPSKQYIGMAPEADIIMVSNYGDDLINRGLTTVGTLDGYDYIRTKANALGKRFVINTSQGTNLGPHDGTSLFEQAINADVAKGSIICLAAGNEAISDHHASVRVTTFTPEEIECKIKGDTSSIPMDIWYKKNDRLMLRIKESADTEYVSLFPAVNSTETYSFNSINVTVTTNIGSLLNGDNEIYISFQPKNNVNNLRMKLQFSVQPGNTLPDGGRVDLWWERDYLVSFMDHVDQSITIGMPACADSAITVASYNNRPMYGSVDDISTFSGRGPRRDGKIKPDIAGIGGMVISSIFFGGYDTLSGTSMSSPHVAGAVALLLQQDTTLTSYQVKQKLLQAATMDEFTGTVPNPIWGYGKLNVLKAAGYNKIPVIAISKDTLRVNSAFIGFKSIDSVEIQNLGNKDLTISTVTTSDPIFSVNKSSFIVPPYSREQLIVGITPATHGEFSGVITITSDDTMHPKTTIFIIGHSEYSPSISISPDSLSYIIYKGSSANATLTLNNSGAGQLLYKIFIDYSVPEPKVLAQRGTMTTRKWSSESLFRTSSLQHISPTYGTASQLPLIIVDPAGDATGVDILEIRGWLSSGMMTLQIVTAAPFDPMNFVGYLGLDIDQNNNTGMPLPFGLLTHDVGCEFFLQFLDITSNGIQLRDPLWNLVDQYTPIIDTTGNSFTFSIPLAVLQRDDGPINTASVFGTNVGPTDYVPDKGHGSVGFSWLSAFPDRGESSPSSSTEITVHMTSAELDYGEFSASLIVTTNDPNKQVMKVPVRLTVTSSLSSALDRETFLPRVFALYQNYPNPFNPATMIKYDIPKTVPVNLTVYNILGEQVAMLVDENQPAGNYTIRWDCRTKHGIAASGIYFVVIRAGDFTKTLKMTLMK